MNTSPATSSIATLLIGAAGASEGADAGEQTGEFSAALATAADTGSDVPLPEGMPSAAALAFIAHLGGEEPLEPGSAEAGEEWLSQPSAGSGRHDADRAARWASAFLQGVAGRGHPSHGVAVHGEDSAAAMTGDQLETTADALRLLLRAGQGAAEASRPAPAVADVEVVALYGPGREGAAPASSAAMPAHAQLRQPVGTPRWADELGRHMVQMSLRGQQEGSLTLSPEHLGPMEVRISIVEETARVWFGAQHADTRAALADALPRLREMFEGAGLSLGEAGVSQDMPRQDSRASEGPGAGPPETATGELPQTATAVARGVRAALLDTWA